MDQRAELMAGEVGPVEAHAANAAWKDRLRVHALVIFFQATVLNDNTERFAAARAAAEQAAANALGQYSYLSLGSCAGQVGPSSDSPQSPLELQTLYKTWRSGFENIPVDA